MRNNHGHQDISEDIRSEDNNSNKKKISQAKQELVVSQLKLNRIVG